MGASKNGFRGALGSESIAKLSDISESSDKLSVINVSPTKLSNSGVYGAGNCAESEVKLSA